MMTDLRFDAFQRIRALDKGKFSDQTIYWMVDNAAELIAALEDTVAEPNLPLLEPTTPKATTHAKP